MVGDVHIPSLRLPLGAGDRDMAMAVRSADPIGYGCAVQSGARFIPSLLFNSLSTEEIFPDKKVDCYVLRRTMDHWWTLDDP